MTNLRHLIPGAIAFGLILPLVSTSLRAEDRMESFSLPSGNLSCEFSPNTELNFPTISCEREKPSPDRIVLSKTGKAEIFKQVTDPFCCEADTVLAYGTTWQKGPFACLASRDGLTCSAQSGHGFFISREKLSGH
jgi:hypothetical protein